LRALVAIELQDELAGRPSPEFLYFSAPPRVRNIGELQAAAGESVAWIFGRQYRQRAETGERDIGERQRLAGQVAPAVGQYRVHFSEGFPV
jgi:hypothetical protein